jgi:hypothetical protein
MGGTEDHKALLTELAVVAIYIEGGEQHHRKRTFQEEFLELSVKHDVA